MWRTPAPRNRRVLLAVEIVAQAKWVRTAPRKVKLVADTLKGLPVGEALTLCKFIPKAAARDIAKVIRSAQANAEHNFNLDKDDLVVKELRVESGVTMKRAQTRAMGRYFSVFKRTSHITAVVEDRPGLVRRPAPVVPRAQAASPAPEAPAAPAAPEPAAPARRATARKGRTEPQPPTSKKADEPRSPKKEKKKS